MALMDCRALWWLELLRKTARTENHGSRMEAVLSYPRRVHHGKTTSVNPVALVGRVAGRRPVGWGLPQQTRFFAHCRARPPPVPSFASLTMCHPPHKGEGKKAACAYSMTIRGGGRLAAPVETVVQISRAMPI